MTGRRIVALLCGLVLLLAAGGMLIGGGALLRADPIPREGGFPRTPGVLVGVADSQDAAASLGAGTGTQALPWRPWSGDWTVVVIRADGGAGVLVDLRTGVPAPGLGWLAGSELALGSVLLASGALLVAVSLRRACARPAGAQPVPRRDADPEEPAAAAAPPAQR